MQWARRKQFRARPSELGPAASTTTYTSMQQLLTGCHREQFVSKFQLAQPSSLSDPWHRLGCDNWPGPCRARDSSSNLSLGTRRATYDKSLVAQGFCPEGRICRNRVMNMWHPHPCHEFGHILTSCRRNEQEHSSFAHTHLSQSLNVPTAETLLLELASLSFLLSLQLTLSFLILSSPCLSTLVESLDSATRIAPDPSTVHTPTSIYLL